MKIKGIVFSGGGLRGFAFIGCLKALEENNIINAKEGDDIEFYAGCSIGAVMAAMISVGYTATELYDFILHFNYEDVKDLNILGFLENYGIETGIKIQEFLRLMLKKKTGFKNATFKELYEKTGKHLVVNATCVNTHTVEYFDYKNNPDMPVALALRMSISLPFLFVPVSYQGKLYVDGGVIDNFPVHLWENPKEVLGFKLSNNKKEAETIESFIAFAQHTWSSLYGELTRMKMDSVKDYSYAMVPITCVHTFNLVVTKKQRIHIHNQGYKSSKKFLKEFLKQSTKKVERVPNLIKDILSDFPEVPEILEELEDGEHSGDLSQDEENKRDFIRLDCYDRILDKDTICLGLEKKNDYCPGACLRVKASQKQV